jgi:hypothetical protein
MTHFYNALKNVCEISTPSIQKLWRNQFAPTCDTDLKVSTIYISLFIEKSSKNSLSLIILKMFYINGFVYNEFREVHNYFKRFQYETTQTEQSTSKSALTLETDIDIGMFYHLCYSP